MTKNTRQMDLEPSLLISQPVAEYQRAEHHESPDKRTARQKRFGRNWDTIKAHKIIVSERDDGKLVIIDGLNRVKAAHYAGIKKVCCLIYRGLTVEEEARMYFAMNGEVKRPMALDLYKAALISGEQWAIGITEIVSRFGLKIGSYNNTDNRFIIKSVGTLRTIYSAYHEGFLVEVLQFISDTWNLYDDPACKEGEFIRGVAEFLGLINKSNFTRDDAKAKLSQITPLQIKRKKLELTMLGGETGFTGFTNALVYFFNKGRSSRKLVKTEKNND